MLLLQLYRQKSEIFVSVLIYFESQILMTSEATEMQVSVQKIYTVQDEHKNTLFDLMDKRLLAKLPGNANQLVDSTSSCWEAWLPFSARWGTAALTSRCPHVSQRALAKQMDWPYWTKWPGVLQVTPDITRPDHLWLFPLGVHEGQSLCTSTTHNRGWAAGTHHCSCQLGHAGYAAESLVQARLSHWCLPSNKRGTHWVCVIPHETVSVYATVDTNFVRIFQSILIS